MIKNNIAQYSGERNSFVCLDITNNEFPEADLWICRDCFFHLSFDDTLRALQKYIESGIPYILTTTHSNVDTFNNVDTNTGDFRLIDLFSSPYYFPRSILFRIEDCTKGLNPKEMCLWPRDQVIDSVRKIREVISKNTD